MEQNQFSPSNSPNSRIMYEQYLREHQKEFRKELKKDSKDRPKSRTKRVRVELSNDSTEGKIWDKTHGGMIYSQVQSQVIK